MSIGITPTPYQPTSAALDFSALSEKSPQTNTFHDENAPQAVDAGAMLFNSAAPKNVSFGQPDNSVQSPQDANNTANPESNLIKLFSALIVSLLQMLMNLNKKQDTDQDSSEWQDPFQNNGGLGTPSTDSGDSGDGSTLAATGDGGGDTPTATGGNTPSVEGSSENDDGVTPQLANPNHTSGTGPVSDTAGANDQAGKVIVVKDTIKVAANTVYDAHGATFTADNSMGNGDQSENQKPLFELAEGATLKNANLGENEVDGIHVKAKDAQQVTIDNVHAENVGEDMITVKGEGGAKVTNLQIKNSSAENADDKVFQLNANTHLNITGFEANNFGTLVRTNGEKQFDDMNIKLDGVDANHGKFALVKSDSEDLQLETSNIAMTDVKHAYDKTKASTQHTEL
ncbi:pectate lyase [Pseudomonas savastanoi pv. phaseolicola]|uniref:pectate lyase n=1 Tax=Pseudomonas savastanoi TaxID=29438 RepID=UPI00030696E0|nr:pectate lyase [Pseudomonas savastanoi]MBN3468045.1 pectate lyase [Pseudomonas savastanoi pv. phaseolicola]MBN3475185.1 pectate lyase [Pseudomonas savastanoi pv. phaseolicola]